jgi:hypothetical protein
MDSFGQLFVHCYFTWQWYTPWLLAVSALAAAMAYSKNRNPVGWFACAYFLTPLFSLVFLYIASPKDRGLRSGPSAPLLASLLLIVGAGVAWSAVHQYPGMWRSVSGLTRGFAFQPQIITVKRPVTVRTAEKDVALVPGTRIWAAAKRDGAYVVQIGRSQATLPVDAATY